MRRTASSARVVTMVSVNNLSKEYNKMKKEIKNPENIVKYTTQTQWKPIVSIVKKILQT